MKKSILQASLLGIIVALFAVIAEQLTGVAAQIFWGREIVLDFYENITSFLVLAVFIEEIFKYFFLRWAIFSRLAIQGKKFIAAGFFFGLFFGIAEITLIIFSSSETKNLLQNLDRNLVNSLIQVILIQTATALYMSALIAKQEKPGLFSSFKILSFPVIIHLLFNFLIIQKGDFTDWLVGIVLSVVFITNLVIISLNFQALD